MLVQGKNHAGWKMVHIGYYVIAERDWWFNRIFLTFLCFNGNMSEISERENTPRLVVFSKVIKKNYLKDDTLLFTMVRFSAGLLFCSKLNLNSLCFSRFGNCVWWQEEHTCVLIITFLSSSYSVDSLLKKTFHNWN